MIRKHAILAFAAVAALTACGISGDSHRDGSVPLQSVESVDLTRYAGKWYEVARYPFFFERACVGATAEYGLREDGVVTVLNTCLTEDGSSRQSDGIAKPLDDSNARLAVTFIEPLLGNKANYVVMGLRPDYSVAVVGNDDGKTGWILSRTPTLSEADRAWALEVFQRNGYDPTGLIWNKTE